MATYRIEYKHHPTNYSSALSMTVEAESLDDALITAIVTLDRQGVRAQIRSLGYGEATIGLTDTGRKKIAQFELRASGSNGASIHNAYAVGTATLPGRVV